MRRLNPSLIAGGLIVGIVVLMALVSFVWTPYDATFVNPAARLAKPSWSHWFGTDKFGRDVLSQIMVGSRTTLFVGVVAVGVAAVIGVPLGILAAMARRWPSELIMRTNDLLLAFPALLLAIMFGAVFGASTLTAMIAIGIASVPSFARVIRSGALQVMRTEYVLAARSIGVPPVRILRKHVFPNAMAPLLAMTTLGIGGMVGLEAALTFLGVGLQPPAISWGSQFGVAASYRDTPHLFIWPALFISTMTISFMIIGDSIRDALDPKLLR